MKELPTQPPPQEGSTEWLPLKRTRRKSLGFGNKPGRSDKGHDLWLLTLSDLLLLLMIFFVLLFGLTLQQQQQWPYTLGSSVEASMKVEETPNQEKPASPEEPAPEGILASLETELRNILTSEKGLEGVSVARQANHLILTFPEKIVFDPGRAELKPFTKPILDKVASLASSHPRLVVEVQGHTDDRPIHTQRYPSNWELSVDRATQVVKALIGLGLSPSQISPRGFGEYRPVYPNDSDSNRQKNRRVEIQFSLAPPA